MPPETGRRLEQELALIDRFASSYQIQFSALIQELNTKPTPETGTHCLRLCVEAVNMLLDAQRQLASAIRQSAK